MQYLITNKLIKFLLFVSFFMLISCSQAELRPPKDAELKSIEPLKTVSAVNTDTDLAEAMPSIAKEEINLWQRLFSLYQLPAIENKRVQAEINWYKNHPEYLQRVQKNAVPYLYFVVSEIEKRGIPGELALLPIVESAYRPFAYSHGRAAGLWQFIPSTGKYFGLEQNWWYDGRRDVYASTHAALKYLTQLSKRFDNDWLLALASYNAGGGTISSAIKRNKQLGRKTDFWSLGLRQETKHYVPKLIAIATILANPEKYHIELINIPNKPYFERVNTIKQIDLGRASELADISIEELYILNPSFNQWATSPTGPYYLLIPKQKSASFKNKLKTLPDSQRLKWMRHKVKRGETLGHIARRYRTTIAQIKRTNPIKNHTIRAGKYLLIPTASYDDSLYTDSATMRKNAIVNTKRRGHKIEYYIKSGDSFWRLAKQYQVSVRDLAKWNAMAPGDTLKIGQKMVIWSKDTSLAPRTQLKSTRKNQTIHYTVRKGDSLYLISKKFKVSITDLKRWNVLNKKYLKPGQKLKIIVDVTRS
ncbi:MAG: lytic transglycosylase [Cycloclasticus sp.]|nr:MAG: lytic transglycosylase [Cycloclasticus sp.]